MLIKDNENELYHSGIYLGKDYSDGIKHWKYLKKIEIEPGKYRYIYYDPKVNPSKKVFDAYMDADSHGHNTVYKVNGETQDWWEPDEKLYKKAERLDFKERVNRFKNNPLKRTNIEAVLEQPLNKLWDLMDAGKKYINKLTKKK